jgi:hypothetical protein
LAGRLCVAVVVLSARVRVPLALFADPVDRMLRPSRLPFSEKAVLQPLRQSLLFRTMRRVSVSISTHGELINSQRFIGRERHWM